MISTRITKRIFVAIVDILILSISLYFSISIRKLTFQSPEDYLKIFYPFLIIIFINILVFYIYGLYDKITVKIYKELDKRILSSQIISSIIGAIIFYTSSYFFIAPKTILIIYILISSFLVYIWRKSIKFIMKSTNETNILIVAEGEELSELMEELKQNKFLNIKKITCIDLAENKNLDLYTKIKDMVINDKYNTLSINMHHPYIKNSISLFYDLLLEKVNIINFADLYEDVLQKIPLKNIDAGWFFNNLYIKKNNFYENSKRVLDLLFAIPIFLISLIFYPFIFIILKIEDGGKLFYISQRIGRNNKIFNLYKFRSMTDLKYEEIDSSNKNEINRITKFGRFIRKTRIDELPQIINVIKGDMSLIGPRPEIPKLVKEYENQIAFYGIRHQITPGLSGYAQIYQEQKSVPKFGVDTNATKEKLSFDIYYIKHRSMLLDISLILKTIKNLISRSGI